MRDDEKLVAERTRAIQGLGVRCALALQNWRGKMKLLLLALILMCSVPLVSRADSLPAWNLSGTITVAGNAHQETLNFSFDYSYQPWALHPVDYQGVVSNAVASGAGDLGDMAFHDSHFDPLQKSWVAFTNTASNEIDLYLFQNFGQLVTPEIEHAELWATSCLGIGACSGFFISADGFHPPATTYSIAVTPIQTPEPLTLFLLVTGLVAVVCWRLRANPNAW